MVVESVPKMVGMAYAIDARMFVLSMLLNIIEGR